ncbi:MAG: hypothetical protein J6V76_02480 [Bacteroidales bacterium]|nr:hypothetical protein [Bacteroidales bacterium]
MARKLSKKDCDEILAQKSDLAKLIMKKIGMKYDEFIQEAEALLIHEYSGLLSSDEKQKYNRIIFAE